MSTFIKSDSCLRCDLKSCGSRRWCLFPSGPGFLFRANVFLAIWKTFWIGAKPPPPLITTGESFTPLLFSLRWVKSDQGGCKSQVQITPQSLCPEGEFKGFLLSTVMPFFSCIFQQQTAHEMRLMKKEMYASSFSARQGRET